MKNDKDCPGIVLGEGPRTECDCEEAPLRNDMTPVRDEGIEQLEKQLADDVQTLEDEVTALEAEVSALQSERDEAYDQASDQRAAVEALEGQLDAVGGDTE